MKLIKRLVKVFGVLLLLVLIGMVGRTIYAIRDRNPGYAVNLDIKAEPGTNGLRAGFARKKINPDLSDSKRPVWVAGFSQNRAATKVHDDLSAVAFVIDDGRTRVGVVSLDAIGFFHDEVIAVRRAVKAEAKLDYIIVCSTHNHSTPDLMGLWGKNIWNTGVDPAYRQLVIENAAAALSEAAGSMRPASVAFHQIAVEPEGLVTDTRKPHVYDADIRVMHFLEPGTTNTIGSLVTWGNHPETPWSRNTELTADFCGYLREALEAKVGGIHCYINGAIGGLMTTSPSVEVKDPYTAEGYKTPSHEKAKALGQQLAVRVLPVLEQSSLKATNKMPIGIWARTIEVPLENPVFFLAPILGLIDRGHSSWKKLRTEVALLTLGEASIACIPGEIYPEIVNGGIETPAGADFPVAPVEVPPIREFMPGKYKFIFGLANDEIGYIIPRSEWDRKKPYLYNSEKRPYGEINSTGPEAARVIHRALLELAGHTK